MTDLEKRAKEVAEELRRMVATNYLSKDQCLSMADNLDPPKPKLRYWLHDGGFVGTTTNNEVANCCSEHTEVDVVPVGFVEKERELHQRYGASGSSPNELFRELGKALAMLDKEGR